MDNHKDVYEAVRAEIFRKALERVLGDKLICPQK